MIEQAGRIVAIETADNGDPIFVDERGRKWTSPAGRSDWREVEPPPPVPPKSRRDRRSRGPI